MYNDFMASVSKPTKALYEEWAQEYKKKSNGIDVCFHYYDNNWHYIRNWGHLKSQNSLIPLSKELKNGLSYLKKKSFEKSDHFIGRNISCLIKLSWKESEVVKRAKVMASIISSITS